MKIGIIGLGLIGGSMAMSIRKHTEHTVFGYDIDPQVMLRAKAVEAIHDDLTDDLLPGMDIVLVALFICIAGAAFVAAAMALSHLVGRAAELQEDSDLTI